MRTSYTDNEETNMGRYSAVPHIYKQGSAGGFEGILGDSSLKMGEFLIFRESSKANSRIPTLSPGRADWEQVLGGNQSLTGCGPGQPALGGPDWARVLIPEFIYLWMMLTLPFFFKGKQLVFLSGVLPTCFTRLQNAVYYWVWLLYHGKLHMINMAFILKYSGTWDLSDKDGFRGQNWIL